MTQFAVFVSMSGSSDVTMLVDIYQQSNAVSSERGVYVGSATGTLSSRGATTASLSMNVLTPFMLFPDLQYRVYFTNMSAFPSIDVKFVQADEIFPTIGFNFTQQSIMFRVYQGKKDVSSKNE
jgi:hypothetical protein